MGVLREVLVSLLGVVLTIIFEFVTLGIVNPSKLDEARENSEVLIQILAVQFDLFIVAVSLLFGAAVNTASTANQQQKLVAPSLGLIVVLLLLLALPALSRILPEYSNWLRITIPVVLAAGALGWTISAIWR